MFYYSRFSTLSTLFRIFDDNYGRSTSKRLRIEESYDKKVRIEIFYEFTEARFMAQDVTYPGEGSMCVG